MNLNEVLDRVAKGRATIGDIGFVVKELRAAKREKRRSEKALKLMALNDSRIIGKLKRENREMWKALRVPCFLNIKDHCHYRGQKPVPCKDMRNCPLLKAKVKK
jgi:ribosomal protein L32